MADIEEWVPGGKEEWSPDSMMEDEGIYSSSPRELTGLRGVFSDATRAASHLPISILKGLMGLPKEARGAASQFDHDRSRFLGNVGTGFGNLGHGILSSLGATRDYLSRKELIPDSSPSFRLPESILPKQFNYAQSLGVTGKKDGDELLQSVASQLALAAPSSKLFELASEIPLTKAVGGKKLNQVRDAIKERGGVNLQVPDHILKDAKQYLPKEIASKKLLKKASEGDYQALFTLQSDLNKRGHSLKRSFSGADRNHGQDAINLRKRLLTSMKEGLSNQGHKDLSELLSLGQKRYAQHMKIRPYALALGAAALGQTGIPSALKNLVLK